MKTWNDQLKKLMDEVTGNKKLTVTTHQLQAGYDPTDIKDIEAGTDIQFHTWIIDFYKQVGSFTLQWTLDRAAMPDIPDEDADNIAGSINILNPFDMIMSKKGDRWKDVLWFDQPGKPGINSFLPFDFASSELIAGFPTADNKTAGKLQLYDFNDGLQSATIDPDQYLQQMIDARGWLYWQEILTEKSGPDYDRYMKYMPLLFDESKK